ncbi:hypothetical protein D3C71_1510690 [compost metagenome]
MTPVTRQTLQADTVHLPHQFLAALGKALPRRLVRIDHDKQLASPGGLGARVVLPVELEGKIATGQCRREQLDHHRQRRALVPAERQQRAALENRLRVRGRLAEAVYAHPFRQAFTLAGGNLHIAMGNGAGGQVEDNRPALGPRCSEGNRVGAEQRPVGTVGHHAGHAVDHAQCHKALFSEGFDIRPQGREMVRVTDRQHRDAGTSGLLHQ